MKLSFRNIIWGVSVGILVCMVILAIASGDAPMTELFFLAALLLISFPLPKKASSSRARFAARIFVGLNTIALLSLAAVLLIQTTQPTLTVVWVFIFPFAALFIVFILFLSLKNNLAFRRRRAMVVLAYLEQAVRMNLPLVRLLAAAESSETGMTALRLRAVRMRLESGLSIADAINLGLPELSSRMLALLTAAERIGQLPRAVSRLVREDRTVRFRDPLESTFLSVYPILMSLGLLFVVGTIMVFVIPKYEQIFHDFKTDLPPVTVLLIEASRDFSIYIMPILLVVALVFIGAWLRNRFWAPREGTRFWLRRFTRHRDLSDAFTVVADSLVAGVPLNSAVASAAELPVGKSLRRKFEKWSSNIERGMATADAARDAQLPRLVVGLSGTADIAAAAEVFRFLARYYNSRFSRVVQLLRGAAVPAMVFFFGAIVMTVALALFLPMVNLIDSVQHRHVFL